VVLVRHTASNQALFMSHAPAGSGLSFGVSVDTGGTPSAVFYETIFPCDVDTAHCLELQTNSPAITANVWHHVTVVFSSGTGKVYVDGTDDTDVYTGLGSVSNLANPAVPHRIGVLSGSGNAPTFWFLDGDISVIRLYDRLLSPAEVAANVAAEDG
jgi:hypothetical protein